MFLVSPDPFEVKFLGKTTLKAEMVCPVAAGPEVRGDQAVSSVKLAGGQGGLSQSEQPPAPLSCPRGFSSHWRPLPDGLADNRATGQIQSAICFCKEGLVEARPQRFVHGPPTASFMVRWLYWAGF